MSHEIRPSALTSSMMENEKKDGTGTAPCSTENTNKYDTKLSISASSSQVHMQFDLVGSIYDNDCIHRNTEKLSTTNERNLCSHFVFTWVPKRKRSPQTMTLRPLKTVGFIFLSDKNLHIFTVMPWCQPVGISRTCQWAPLCSGRINHFLITTKLAAPCQYSDGLSVYTHPQWVSLCQGAAWRVS